ncbi:hypothetical protein BESB_021310 [Besnoitia besnoiti]|uniref:Uncharacterized protein n=1 Tax=Besnoitia besnoiti TaxID=94643 RepID=A0A2A9M9Y6_BESBE|nr:hypothetical protein BESB_021310 [Besnoitia besnoiti]PFH32190.1 hypothetical protein BESB_021310 [Besnoitia besnoiti]
MKTKSILAAFAMCVAVVGPGGVTAQGSISEEEPCCVPHDASGEKELAKAIRTAVSEGSHELSAEAALARELENEADAKLYKEDDKKLIEAEQRAALAREADEDAKHDLISTWMFAQEEKDKHEEAEMSGKRSKRD